MVHERFVKLCSTLFGCELAHLERIGGATIVIVGRRLVRGGALEKAGLRAARGARVGALSEAQRVGVRARGHREVVLVRRRRCAAREGRRLAVRGWSGRVVRVVNREDLVPARLLPLRVQVRRGRVLRRAVRARRADAQRRIAERAQRVRRVHRGRYARLRQRHASEARLLARGSLLVLVTRVPRLHRLVLQAQSLDSINFNFKFLTKNVR